MSGPNPGFRGSGPFIFKGNLRVIAMKGIARTERCELPWAHYKVQRACFFLHFKSKIDYVSIIQVKTCVKIYWKKREKKEGEMAVIRPQKDPILDVALCVALKASKKKLKLIICFWKLQAPQENPGKFGTW